MSSPTQPTRKLAARVASEAEFSALLQADADRAVADGVGYRRPCACLPARPTTDNQVAYALYDVKMAARRAFEMGATEGEIASACESGRYP